MKSSLVVRVAGAIIAAQLLAISVFGEAPVPTAPKSVQSIALPGIHNAFRASDQIYSGSQPEGDEAFAALAKLGIKTILSVDGSKPDLELARKHGLKYIHLPYGYDGIPTNRINELSKVALTQTGPIFVHCHHGKHRGPAAVAVMCEASGSWTPAQAESWLRAAGTSEDYPGLYRAAKEYTVPPRAKLDAIKNLPEVAQSSTLVDAMVSIDGYLDHLKLAQAAGWKTPPDHPDISPAHEATLLWEQLRELSRLPDTTQRPADYRTKLTEAESLADSLRNALKQKPETAQLDTHLKKLSQNCMSCHKTYRNQ